MYEMLLALNVIIYVWVLAWYARKPCATVFHPATFYAAVHGFIFVVRPIFAWFGHYRAVYDIYDFMPTLAEKMTTIGVTALTYLVIMTTMIQLAPQRMEFSKTPDDIRRRMQWPVVIVALTLGLLGAYSALKGIDARAYGTDTMQTTKGGYRINTSGSGYFNDAQQLMVPITLMIAWVFRFRLLSLLPFTAFVILKSSSGGRGPFMIAIAAMGLLYLYEQRRRWPTPKVLPLFAIALVLFVFVGQDRGHAIRGLFLSDQVTHGAGNSSADDKNSLLDGMDYANLEYVEFMVHTIPKRTGTYSFFVENLQLFTEPVPRALWSGKPVGPPIQLYNLWDYGHPWGMTIAVPGQGWQGLGWVGVVLYAFLAGAFLAAIYRVSVRKIDSPFILMAYLPFLAGTILYLRDGALLTILRSELFYLAPVFAAYAFSGDVRIRIRLFSELGPKRYAMVLDRVRKKSGRQSSALARAEPRAVSTSP